MPTPKQTDIFPNIMVVQVNMSGANTITFNELNVGLNLFDKVGLLLQRIEYEFFTTTWADIDTDSDWFIGALTSSNSLTTLVAQETQVIDLVKKMRIDAGAAASASLVDCMIAHDFSTLSGGGILIPPKPLYGAMLSSGMTVAGGVNIRVYFTIRKLSDAEYLELLETRRAFG